MSTHRVVTIVRDSGSPLWAIQCAKPCHPDGRPCMGRDLDQPQYICYLGGSITHAGAVKLAESVGYTVITEES